MNVLVCELHFLPERPLALLQSWFHLLHTPSLPEMEGKCVCEQNTAGEEL